LGCINFLGGCKGRGDGDGAEMDGHDGVVGFGEGERV